MNPLGHTLIRPKEFGLNPLMIGEAFGRPLPTTGVERNKEACPSDKMSLRLYSDIKATGLININ